MINLIPKDRKSDLIYAKRNTKLLKYLMIAFCLLILVASTVLVGKIYLSSENKRLAQEISESEAKLKDQNIDENFAKIKSISENIKLIITVLSKQVVFSELLKNIGNIMPQGAILSGIEISEVGGGIDIEANATNSDAATQVQINLTAPESKLFDKADIISVDCSGNEVLQNYPCNVKIRALFTTDNPYLFINLRTKESSDVQ